LGELHYPDWPAVKSLKTYGRSALRSVPNYRVSLNVHRFELCSLKSTATNIPVASMQNAPHGSNRLDR